MCNVLKIGFPAPYHSPSHRDSPLRDIGNTPNKTCHRADDNTEEYPDIDSASPKSLLRHHLEIQALESEPRLNRPGLRRPIPFALHPHTFAPTSESRTFSSTGDDPLPVGSSPVIAAQLGPTESDRATATSPDVERRTLEGGDIPSTPSLGRGNSQRVARLGASGEVRFGYFILILTTFLTSCAYHYLIGS